MIFSWLAERQRNKEAVTQVKKAHTLIARLGDLIADYPMAYIDESWLPGGKERMKAAIKIAFYAAPSAKQMEALKIGWMSLSHFKPNIGNKPIVPDPPHSLSDLAGRASLDRWLEISNQVELDQQRDEQELLQFISTPHPKFIPNWL